MFSLSEIPSLHVTSLKQSPLPSYLTFPLSLNNHLRYTASLHVFCRVLCARVLACTHETITDYQILISFKYFSNFTNFSSISKIFLFFSVLCENLWILIDCSVLISSKTTKKNNNRQHNPIYDISFKDYPPENSSLWYTKIWFVNNSRDRIVEVQFQPAPAAYGIRYYNIQLRQIKYSGYEGMSSRITTHAKMEFALSSSVRFSVSFHEL